MDELKQKTVEDLRALNVQCGRSLDPLNPTPPMPQDQARALRQAVQAELRSRGETIYANVRQSTRESAAKAQTVRLEHKTVQELRDELQKIHDQLKERGEE